MTDSIQEEFSAGGFVRRRGLLAPEGVAAALERIRALSGLRDGNASGVSEGRLKGFLAPGLVCRDSALWSLITDAGILGVVRSLLGPGAVFCVGGDVGFAHRSGYPFHRDTWLEVDRGPDWDPDLKEYGILRVITYFHETRATAFGVCSGSHVPGASAGVGDGAERWLEVQPGEVVFFDARLRHSGRPDDFPKYGVILTYAVDNLYARDYHFYRRLVQIPHIYEPPSPELIALLRQQGLFQEAMLDPALCRHYAQAFAGLERKTPTTRYRLR